MRLPVSESTQRTITFESNKKDESNKMMHNLDPNTGFASNAEVVAAMQHPLYKDALLGDSYRKIVERKVELMEQSPAVVSANRGTLRATSAEVQSLGALRADADRDREGSLEDEAKQQEQEIGGRDSLELSQRRRLKQLQSENPPLTI